MSLGIVILAAGQGKRMKSALPKVLHPVLGQPMLAYVLETATQLHPDKLIVVVGYRADLVQKAFEKEKVSWVMQEKPQGTGHAVLCTMEELKTFKGNVLVLYGDVPAITVKTLDRLIDHHQSSQASITLLTCHMENPTGYGRIIKDAHGAVVKITEEKDADHAEKKVSEVNTGIGVYTADFLKKHISKLNNDNQQKEFYLTDLVEIAVQKGLPVVSMMAENELEVFGINDEVALKKMEDSIKTR